MDEPSTSAVSEPGPSNDINGQTADESEEVPMEIVKDDEATPARLVINNFDDENEETLFMTIEEAQNYILSKVETFIRDPNVNPLLVLKTQISTLHEKISTKSEEFSKLNKMFDALYRDQVKFLRHIGVMPKIDTKTVGVSVDLPWLPESVPGMINEDMLKLSGDRTFLQPVGRVPKKESSGTIECIDLTDDADAPAPSVSTPVTTVSTAKSPTPTTSTTAPSSTSSSSPAQNNPLTVVAQKNGSFVSPAASPSLQHPAPLPTVAPSAGAESEVPPKPRLKISVDKNGIVLQWDLPPEAKNMKITGFEIVGYQEKNNVPASTALWKKIGVVDPMPLPMSCTLTQFVEGFKYHFSIRAFCKDDQFGHYSDPASIMFVPETRKS